MDDGENSSFHVSRKNRLPQLITQRKNSQIDQFENKVFDECIEKTSCATLKSGGFKMQFPFKTEEMQEKKKKENSFPSRPRTVSGGTRKSLESGANERSPGMQTSKSFSVQIKKPCLERQTAASPYSAHSSSDGRKRECSKENKTKIPINNRTDVAKGFESISSLSQAVREQGQIIDMLHSAREEVRQKMADAAKKSGSAAPAFCASKHPSLEPFDSVNFENSYSGTLEEIFQAWANLFYFIINLKINLVRVSKSSESDPFFPDSRVEAEIVGQAIECVKFFSKLKIKSLISSVEDIRFPQDRSVSETQIKDYEEKVSSPFLYEMNFVQKKAKELLQGLKEKEKMYHRLKLRYKTKQVE